MSKKRKLTKKIIIISLVAVVVVGGIAGIIAKKKYSDSFVKVVPAYEINQMYGSDSLGDLMLYGNLKEGSVQSVTVKQDLEIKEIKVKEGDTVKKGDVLVEYNVDSLKLSVAQCQTNIGVLSNSIKIAENELTTLKGLIPAENAPEQAPSSDASVSVECENNITEKTVPLAGDGSENSPFIFNATTDCVVSKQYMQFLAGDKVEADTTANSNTQRTNSKYAIFHIYNNNGVMLYSWLVDGSKLTESDIKDWNCNNGVTVSDDGNIQIEQGVNLFAMLVAYSDLEQSFEMPDSDTNSDDFVNENNQGDTISSDDNYVYTKAQIQEMINQKNEELSALNYSMRQAEIDLKQAEKTLEVGNETASISGKVTYVANSKKDAEEKGAYMTIVNDSATSVVSTVSENDLEYLEVGAKAEVTDETYENTVMGTVTYISDEVSKNTSQNMMIEEDDTATYYDITIELDDKLDIEENETVSINIDTNTTENTFFLDSIFVRNENGKHYVMVANENNVLEKRYVEVGQDYYSVALQILGGITEDDRIALPYGKAVEGAPTKDASFEEIQSGFLF